jgi:ABC-type arginine transport system ATPase subunit
MAPRCPNRFTSSGRTSNVASVSDEGLPVRDAKFIQILRFDFFYGNQQALFDIDMDIPEREITAFIGASGCGKTTLLRSINRLSDLVKGSPHNGDIKLREQSVRIDFKRARGVFREVRCSGFVLRARSQIAPKCS